MKPLITLFVILLFHCSNGQNIQLWGDLRSGNFNVGFQDTIVFNTNKNYSFQDYNGPKPYYVNIWFPTSEEANPIAFNEFFQFKPLSSLNDTIRQMMMQSFIQFGVTSNLDTWEEIEYTEIQEGLKKEILRATTRSTTNIQSPKRKFPTIIYHHGNGGVPFENSVLFEFLASHGYVVVSSYYHWPDLWNKKYHEHAHWPLEDIEFVVALAKQLDYVDAENLQYIGHSWGASLGLRMNHRASINFKRYLLFDSTIEHFGLEENKIMTPTLDSLLRYHPERFITETIDITSRRRYLDAGKEIIQTPQFKPFAYLKETDLKLITLNEILNHESFTSLGVIRSVFADEYFQVDAKTVEAEFKTYQELIRVTMKILDGENIESNKILTLIKQ